MSERDLRAQKRNRIRRREQLQVVIQTARTGRTKKKKAKVEAEKKEVQVQIQELSRSCLLSKTADAVMCLIFTFLNARDHWKLSRSCTKMERISLLPQASPTQVNISELGTDPYRVFTEESKTIAKRLMKFYTIKLTMPPNEDVEWARIGAMTQLQELIFETNGNVDDDEVNEDDNLSDMQWLPYLTRLTKLRIPTENLRYLSSLPYSGYCVPTSLTHLNIFPYKVTGFQSFNLQVFASARLNCLTMLQVLKLPKGQYYPLEILDIGKTFPLLRELSFGFLDVRERKHVNLSKLSSCAHLEYLKIGIGPQESTTRWESLTSVPSLRSLTVAIYPRQIYADSLTGLSQVTQLTQLKLMPHRDQNGVDISHAIEQLVDASNAQNAVDANRVPSAIMPQLKTLLIADGLQLSNAIGLSAFSAVEELELPSSTCYFPDVHRLPYLPRLRALRVTDNGTSALVDLFDHYKDQVTELVYKPSAESCQPHVLLRNCGRLTKLTTLKLPAHCLSTKNSKKGEQSMVAFFKQHLPAIVKVEVLSSDNAIEADD